jgi:outer membrane receptor protein involved in Fe transport
MKTHRPLVILSLLATTQTVAQTADDATLAEVVVTAQRREERLQDVPAAISALSGESLSRQHLLGNADLAAQVPSLSFTVQGPGESTLAIRGLGTAYGLAPAVSYYINETPLDIRTDGVAGVPDIDFFDVERVEVLRGPQGTLYGSSSMGGALRILTAQPDPSAFAARIETGISSIDGGGVGYLGKGALNLPLGEDVAIRMVGAFEHIGGYVDRAAPPVDYSDPNSDLPITAREVNDADLKSGRIIGLWRVNENVSIKPSIMFSQVEAGATSEYFDNLPRYAKAGTYANPLDSKLVTGNLLIEADLGFASFMSSTSVLSRDVDSRDDYSLLLVNLAPAFGLPVVDYPTLHRLSSSNEGVIQEFRLTSPADQALRWVAGAYASRLKQHSIELLDSEDFATAIEQTDSTSIYTFDQHLEDQQIAVFADLTYRVLDNLEVTVGARYYQLRNRLENTQTGVIAAPDQPRVRAEASGTSPRAVISYRPTDDVTVYATAARGYRPGGPNVGLPDGIGCGLTDAYAPLYDPDSVWNYELGAKTELLDRRVSVNVAAYQIDWKDVQQAVTDPGCGYIIVANVGKARSQGFEAEIVMRPIDALTLTASGSYTDAEFTSIAVPYQEASAVVTGDPMPDVPRKKLNLGAEYNRELGADRVGFVRADWMYLSSVPTGFTTLNERPSYDSLGASVGMRTDRYEVSLYGRNLTNEDGIIDLRTGATVSFEDVFKTRISTPPRTVGLNLKMNF